MTAEEFLIEKFKELEKKFNDAEETVEDTKDLLADKIEELNEYRRLVDLLQIHFSKSASGVHFDFFNVTAKPEEIEILKNFFDLDDDDEE